MVYNVCDRLVLGISDKQEVCKVKIEFKFDLTMNFVTLNREVMPEIKREPEEEDYVNGDQSTSQMENEQRYVLFF